MRFCRNQGDARGTWMLVAWISSIYLFVPLAFGRESIAEKWDEIFRRSADIVAESKKTQGDENREDSAPFIVAPKALPAPSASFVSYKKQGNIEFLTVPYLGASSGAEVKTFLVIDGQIFNSYKELLPGSTLPPSGYREEQE